MMILSVTAPTPKKEKKWNYSALTLPMIGTWFGVSVSQKVKQEAVADREHVKYV